jgi:hypothetical protein
MFCSLLVSFGLALSKCSAYQDMFRLSFLPKTRALIIMGVLSVQNVASINVMFRFCLRVHQDRPTNTTCSGFLLFYFGLALSKNHTYWRMFCVFSLVRSHECAVPSKWIPILPNVVASSVQIYQNIRNIKLNALFFFSSFRL